MNNLLLKTTSIFVVIVDVRRPESMEVNLPGTGDIP